MDIESERKRQIAEGFQSEATRIERANAELTRVMLWHRTYNAALTGLLARDMPGGAAWFRSQAIEHADAAHGPLKA